MNRRGFLRGILASGVAPFVVTAAGVLMPVRQRILTPTVTLPQLAEGQTLHILNETEGPLTVYPAEQVVAMRRWIEFGANGKETYRSESVPLNQLYNLSFGFPP